MFFLIFWKLDIKVIFKYSKSKKWFIRFVHKNLKTRRTLRYASELNASWFIDFIHTVAK